MASSRIEALVRPVLLKICDFYTFKKSGQEASYQLVTSELHDLLSRIKREVDLDDSLRKEYEQIEKPLVFFIDYIIQESRFSFSREYQPLARVYYSELSGDDKFFDLLDATLEDSSSSKEIIELYYLMLGLGFDGAYRREPKEVINRLYRCSDVLDGYMQPQNEVLFPELNSDKDDTEKKESKFSIVKYAKNNIVYVLTGVLIVSFLLNLFSIHSNTTGYTKAVEQALEAANPYRNMVAKTPDSVLNQKENSNREGQ